MTMHTATTGSPALRSLPCKVGAIRFTWTRQGSNLDLPTNAGALPFELRMSFAKPSPGTYEPAACSTSLLERASTWCKGPVDDIGVTLPAPLLGPRVVAVRRSDSEALGPTVNYRR